jgi:hypothetical protein
VFRGPFGVIEGPNVPLRDASRSLNRSDRLFEGAPPRTALTREVGIQMLAKSNLGGRRVFAGFHGRVP